MIQVQDRHDADGPVAKFGAAGKTVMLAARDREPVGLLAVADEPRAPSRQVVGDLHELACSGS